MNIPQEKNITAAALPEQIETFPETAGESRLRNLLRIVGWFFLLSGIIGAFQAGFSFCLDGKIPKFFLILTIPAGIGILYYRPLQRIFALVISALFGIFGIAAVAAGCFNSPAVTFSLPRLFEEAGPFRKLILGLLTVFTAVTICGYLISFILLFGKKVRGFFKKQPASARKIPFVMYLLAATAFPAVYAGMILENATSPTPADILVSGNKKLDLREVQPFPANYSYLSPVCRMHDGSEVQWQLRIEEAVLPLKKPGVYAVTFARRSLRRGWGFSYPSRKFMGGTALVSPEQGNEFFIFLNLKTGAAHVYERTIPVFCDLSEGRLFRFSFKRDGKDAPVK